MTTRVVVLGAGFGGLELASRLSASLADRVHVTLVDKNDAFVFGFTKFDVLFGSKTADQVRMPYRDVLFPSVEFRQELVTAIDPATRHVVTDGGSYDADILVVALGADYDPAATPGFVEDGYEFYSLAGAERLRDRLATFDGGDIVMAILRLPFKCPPAPVEGALLLHEYLVGRGIRDSCSIELISPMAMPVPVSPPTSEALVKAMAERGITYTPSHVVRHLDPATHVAHLKDGERRYDLFVGVPAHRVPAVVFESGLTEGGSDGWVKVDPRTLETPFPGVYAIGDCADAPVPRAGVFAESAARTLARRIEATVKGEDADTYDGTGSCYIEFGDGTVAKVEANFLGGPSPVAPYFPPSQDIAAEKAAFAAERRQRWFRGGVD